MNMKTSTVLGFALALAAFSGAVSAQTIYKCTDANGIKIFSTEPCGSNAKVTKYDVPAGDDEAMCRSAASEFAVKPDSAAVDNAKAEMDALTKSTHRGTPAENEAWKQNAQARMDSLQEFVRQQEARNAALSAESTSKQKKVLADCEKQKAERQARLEKEGS